MNTHNLMSFVAVCIVGAFATGTPTEPLTAVIAASVAVAVSQVLTRFTNILDM